MLNNIEFIGAVSNFQSSGSAIEKTITTPDMDYFTSNDSQENYLIAPTSTAFAIKTNKSVCNVAVIPTLNDDSYVLGSMTSGDYFGKYTCNGDGITFIFFRPGLYLTQIYYADKTLDTFYVNAGDCTPCDCEEAPAGKGQKDNGPPGTNGHDTKANPKKPFEIESNEGITPKWTPQGWVGGRYYRYIQYAPVVRDKDNTLVIIGTTTEDKKDLDYLYKPYLGTMKYAKTWAEACEIIEKFDKKDINLIIHAHGLPNYVQIGRNTVSGYRKDDCTQKFITSGVAKIKRVQFMSCQAGSGIKDNPKHVMRILSKGLEAEVISFESILYVVPAFKNVAGQVIVKETFFAIKSSSDIYYTDKGKLSMKAYKYIGKKG